MDQSAAHSLGTNKVGSPDSQLRHDFCQMMHVQEQIGHQTWLPPEPQSHDRTALQTTSTGE